MNTATLKTKGLKLAAMLALTVGLATAAGAVTSSADAAVLDKGCYVFNPGYTSFDTNYKCYIAGDYWIGSSQIYREGFLVKSCSYAGCLLVNGGYAKEWYASGGRWVFWHCIRHNGVQWYVSSC